MRLGWVISYVNCFDEKSSGQSIKKVKLVVDSCAYNFLGTLVSTAYFYWHRFSASFIVLSLVFSFVGPKATSLQAKADLVVDISFTKYVLENGLTLIVHEDHKAPIVAVNVWYHVGSKDERPEKTGFAHLFEHLMFNGSEHYDDSYIQPFERVGATNLNGTTDQDRTNYFQTVPVSALDMVLWMESDRMGHLLGAITQNKLDEQRGVVKNEKRQRENQPYAVSRQMIAESTYPREHPYSWTTIGSMEDLDAATLDDVKEWFRMYYGAANAVVAIAGDVSPSVVLEKVKRYFGDIPSGPPLKRHDLWIAKLNETRRQVVQDRVAQSRIYKVWNVPPWGTRASIHLRLFADVLAAGKSSRLYKRLIYDEETATDVSAFVQLRELGGQFRVVATVTPGEQLFDVERGIDEEMQALLTEGLTQAELDRAKASYISNFVRRLERVGGFGGKSDLLARGEVYGDHPGHYRSQLMWVKQTSVHELRQTAMRWLASGDFTLEVHPFPSYKASESKVDRSSGVPAIGSPPPVRFPGLSRVTLSNGLKVILSERRELPLTYFTLLVDAGFAADQYEEPGTATLTGAMLDEGTKTRTALEISEELRNLGSRLSSWSDLDTSYVSLSVLSEYLDPSLDIFSEVITSPAFSKVDFNRAKSQQLARIEREQSSPETLAHRIFPGLVYGFDHAYGNPFTGTGTAKSVSLIKREDLIKFHSAWVRPNNATLVIVGAVGLDEILPKLERMFVSWQPASIPEKNIEVVSHKSASEIYLVDRPGAQQSIIFAGHLAPPQADRDELSIKVINTVLGGAFGSRLNQNLREDKHWSYGARSYLLEARGQRPFVVYAPVQTDKTKESIIEIKRELMDMLDSRPIMVEELDRAKDLQTLTLPGRWETRGAVSSDIENLVRFGFSDDYYDTLKIRLNTLDVEAISRSALRLLKPDKMVWMIVGDVQTIEQGIRELDLGPIYMMSTEGHLIE